ncbi:ribonuclease H-like domain-containing protein [Tanacetum coccineum]|uniref:Ribonuclease H-like domain-containing protein n=1 Tax=Tanacetum coccineum TaxID=301880 RepID=A0ABQ4YNT0_9ASTR
MAKPSSQNPSSSNITLKEELDTQERPESLNPFLPADQVEFMFDEITFSTNNELVLVFLVAMAILITSLDASNPLHLHANDSNGTPLVSIKLTDVENYRIWASAIRLGLQTKNKMGFITGSVLKSDYAASNLLSDLWDRCNAVVLSWILGSYYLHNVLSRNNGFKQGGLPVSEYYHKLNSLWREFDILTKLPDCVCEARAELIDHGKLMRLMQFLMCLDDVYQPIRSSLLTREILPEVRDAFLIIARVESHRGISSSYVKTKKPQEYVFVARTNDNKRNNNSNWNNGNSSGNVVNHQWVTLKSYIYRIPNLLLKLVQKLMSLLNDKSRSAAHANMAGNLKLNNDVVLFDDLVIPEYCVSLLSVHKLIKDSKLRVSFDETKCVIQDLKREKVLGTGSESTGLYVFDANCDKLAVSNQSDLIHLDVWGLIKWLVGKALAKTSSRPNDDQEGPSGRDGNVHQPVSDSESQPGHGDQSFATPLDDENSSEGYGGSHLEVPIFENVNQSETKEVSPDIRRSSRPSKLSAKLSEFVLDGKVKYGLHRYANHTLPRGEKYCFVTNLNKSVEPSSFEEVSKDINWINAMNE